ncbi:MAG: hypothetical protein ABI763_16005 [Bacteroidota bacterium]
MKNITPTQPKNFLNALNDDQKASFKDQSKVEVFQIEPDDVLWRFISQKNKPPYSDYWIDGETMHSIMTSFQDMGNFQMDVKKHVVRESLAVLNNWSKLSWRIKITFKKAIIVYKGIAGSQKVLSKGINVINKYGKLTPATEYWRGGCVQFVIPEFKNISSDKASEIATVTHFAHI